MEEKRIPFNGRFTHNKVRSFEERVVLTARVFKVWKSLRNKVVLPVKRISHFLHFSLLYVVYTYIQKGIVYILQSTRVYECLASWKYLPQWKCLASWFLKMHCILKMPYILKMPCIASCNTLHHAIPCIKYCRFLVFWNALQPEMPCFCLHFEMPCILKLYPSWNALSGILNNRNKGISSNIYIQPCFLFYFFLSLVSPAFFLLSIFLATQSLCGRRFWIKRDKITIIVLKHGFLLLALL